MRWKRRAYNVIASYRGWTECLLFVVSLAALAVIDEPDTIASRVAVWIGLVAIVGAIIKFGFDSAIWFGLLPKRLEEDNGMWR